jgi:hypothetical protein
MARKKKKLQEPISPADQDAAPANENMTEPVSEPQEPSVPSADETAAVDSSHAADEAAEVPSPDDLLDDVRRALIEDEAHESQKTSKWWKRIGIGGGRQETQSDEPKAVEEIDLPSTPETSIDVEIEELKEELESEEYLEQIDELIDLLDDDTAPAAAPAPKVEEPPVEPEKPADIEQLKKQAFQSRADTPAAETLSEVRSIALEGDEEVFVEVESKPADPWDERVKAVENAFKPYRRYVSFAIAFLGVVIAGIALAIMVSTFQRLRPEPTAVPPSDRPYPTSVSLPGGWAFTLGRGTLTDGQWIPKGAEWLEGTEVCRWVSLPWSRQLEAVVRTLNPEDPIELGMSNSDRLVYQVYSIRQMSPGELQELDTNTPCLLIMLTENDAEKHWVLTALP